MNKGRPREGNQEKGIAKQSKEGSGVKEESSLFIEIEKFLSERVYVYRKILLAST